jgi:hypothetical protein
MNRKKASAIILLVIAGMGLGIVSALWMVNQHTAESTMDSLLFSNDTQIKVNYKFGMIDEEGNFKELMAEERKTATNIALSDAQVQKMLKGREYEIINVMDIPVPDKNNRERKALVTINIRGFSIINVVVNMEKKIVETNVSFNMPFIEPPVPLTKNEEQKAVEIALADSGVKRILNGRLFNITYIENKPINSNSGDGMIVRGNPPNEEELYRMAQEIQLNLNQKSSKKYASVYIEMNESNNSLAIMNVIVDLNESTMKWLSFIRIKPGSI